MDKPAGKNIFILDIDLKQNFSETGKLLPGFTNINVNNKKYFYLGDAINIKKNIDIYNNKFEDILLNTLGHFYLLCIEGNSMYLSSSLFSNFPLYYYYGAGFIIVSSNVSLIKDKIANSGGINEKFILQTILFNYPLFNDSIYNDIKLCPANTYIKISLEKVSFVKYFEIESLYVDNPKSYKKSAEDLSDLFIERYNEYIPEKKSAISFTGGFDGRTLVSCAKYFEQDYVSFSFGKKGFGDVDVPFNISNKLNIPYHTISLSDSEYINSEFLKTGNELIKNTSAVSNYLYVHFPYSAKLLSNNFGYLFAGYFGSELFRALHLTGALNSSELISFFSESDKDVWISNIRNSFKLKYLNENIVKENLEEIIAELDDYKNKISLRLGSLNKIFYIFVFEEIFRKVFGSHIFSQSQYLNVRTPFLDLMFIKELFKTDLAGVNNEFFVKNPLKRFKGQYLYAKIIEKAYPELSKEKVDKGYCPNEILSNFGKLKIIYPYFKKKTIRKVKKANLDNLSIISGLTVNRKYFEDLLNKNKYFNIVEIIDLFNSIKSLPEVKRDLISLVFSILYLNIKDDEKL